jgi:hypothetical protein
MHLLVCTSIFKLNRLKCALIYETTACEYRIFFRLARRGIRHYGSLACDIVHEDEIPPMQKRIGRQQ